MVLTNLPVRIKILIPVLETEKSKTTIISLRSGLPNLMIIRSSIPKTFGRHIPIGLVDAKALLKFLGRGVYRGRRFEELNFSQVRFAKPYDYKITHPRFWTPHSNRFGWCNSLIEILGKRRLSRLKN